MDLHIHDFYIRKNPFTIVKKLASIERNIYGGGARLVNPIISIIVPVYNVEKYISECVESILNQTLTEMEFIFVDDGSSDKSGEILDTFAWNDKRIKVIHKQNAGVSSARNDGLSVCSGDYIYIMDSDDYLETNALEIMYNNAINTGADVVITDHYLFKEDNVQKEQHFFSKEFISEETDIINQIQEMTLHKGYSPFLTSENNGIGIAAPWNKLIKRELIFDNQLSFDPYVEGIFDDGLFTLSVFQFAKKISYVRICTYHYRMLQSSLIHRFTARRIEIDRKVFQRITEFSEKYHKDEEFKKAYYARVILYMVHSFDVYYFNRDYHGSAKENYKEFKAMILSEPYKKAIKLVDINKLNRRQRYVTLLSRRHLIFLIWIIFEMRLRNN